MFCHGRYCLRRLEISNGVFEGAGGCRSLCSSGVLDGRETVLPSTRADGSRFSYAGPLLLAGVGISSGVFEGA